MVHVSKSSAELNNLRFVTSLNLIKGAGSKGKVLFSFINFINQYLYHSFQDIMVLFVFDWQLKIEII